MLHPHKPHKLGCNVQYSCRCTYNIYSYFVCHKCTHICRNLKKKNMETLLKHVLMIHKHQPYCIDSPFATYSRIFSINSHLCHIINLWFQFVAVSRAGLLKKTPFPHAAVGLHTHTPSTSHIAFHRLNINKLG